MKEKTIRFFTPGENTTTKPRKILKVPTKPLKLTGYISKAGKLVFPVTTLGQGAIEADTLRFRIGTRVGKRDLKWLYLVPAQDTQANTFSLEKAAQSYTLALGVILEKGGIDYRQTTYTFSIEPYDFDAGVVGYELRLTGASLVEKSTYTGKPRGRKPKHG